MIASPSTKNPDYLYSWTRDSALVFKLLIEDFLSGDDPSLRGLIDAYISVDARIQQTSNPSLRAKVGSASPSSTLMAPHSPILGGVRNEVRTPLSVNSEFELNRGTVLQMVPRYVPPP